MLREKVSLGELADKIARAVPKFGPAERRLAVITYRLLAQGKPVLPARLAQEAGLPETTVREVLGRWTGVFYDGQGAIVGFWGLAIPEMPHRFIVNGRTLHTWCAWDSLFIPEILGQTARVESRDPVTKEGIALVVAPDGIKEATPSGAVVSFLTPQASFDQDVIVNFCHLVHFFMSEETGRQWRDRHKGTFLLSLDEAFTLGRLTNARNFQEALR